MINTARVKDVLDRQMQGQVPGVALAITHAGEPLVIRCDGLADLAQGQPVQPTTVFRLASVSKPFTALAIMLLERDGLLDVDTSILDYLPGYPTHAARVTVRHLLTHTSGIPNYVVHPLSRHRVVQPPHRHRSRTRSTHPTDLPRGGPQLPVDQTTAAPRKPNQRAQTGRAALLSASMADFATSQPIPSSAQNNDIAYGAHAPPTGTASRFPSHPLPATTRRTPLPPPKIHCFRIATKLDTISYSPNIERLLAPCRRDRRPHSVTAANGHGEHIPRLV